MKCKRILSMLLTLCMVIGLLPGMALTASAAEDTASTGCTHQHDGSCGYVEAVAEAPCDKDCTDTDGDGVTDHAADCAYTPAVEGQPCNHVHDENCGGLTAEEEPPAEEEAEEEEEPSVEEDPDEPEAVTALLEMLAELPDAAALDGMTAEELDEVYRKTVSIQNACDEMSEEEFYYLSAQYPNTWPDFLAFCTALEDVREEAGSPVPLNDVTLASGRYPYGKDMTSSSITLVIEVEGTAASYQWQVADSKTGEFSDISGATSSTYTFAPTSGKWYRCKVNETFSKAVMAVKPGQDGRTWTKPYPPDSSSAYYWYVSNGTMAYMANGAIFDAVGLYTKNSIDYMLCTSYGRKWDMFSNASGTPSPGSTMSASLDALRVSFSETDDYAIIFEADLTDGQRAFSFGCDTQLGDNNTSGGFSDKAALKATVENGELQQVAMIGAGTVASAADTDPAFVIAPVDPASRFWIGNFSSRQTYAYNTSGGSATETIDGQNVVTLLEGADSGMTMSWLNVPSGGSVRFQFSVGDVAHTGAVSGKVDYEKEVLTGLEADTTYVITVGETSYTITANGNGEIPLSGTDTSGNPYDLAGKTLTVAKQGSVDTPAQIEVAGRPTAPSGPSTLPEGEITTPGGVPGDVEVVEVTASSVTIAPIAGQEYFYSTDGMNWIRVEGTQINNLSGDSVQIKTRIAATASAPASAYSEPVIVTLKQMIKDMEGFSASGYTGAYDGAAHSITVTAPEGAEVAYSKTPGTDYTGDTPTYTNAGEYTVYYRVTMDGCYPVYGSETVRIGKAAVTVTADPKSKTYGDADPALTYTVTGGGLVGSDTLIGKLTRAAGTDAGTYAIQQGTLTNENNPNYTITFVSADLTITAKTVTPTIELTPSSFAYDGTAKEPTVTLKDGETVIPSTEYTVTYSNNINVGTEAVATITDEEGGNYTFAQATRNFTITPKGVTPAVAMEDYVYGATPSTPTVSGNESGGTETVYYSTYSDIAANPTHRIVWADMTGTTLNVGTYYMAAHVAATGNYAEGTSAVITFKVTPSAYAAPTAPTVSGFTVTIAEADREKKLEYSLDNTNWVTVPTLNSNGSFDLTGLAENTNCTIRLRQKASADGNYLESYSSSADFTTPARYSVAYNANYGSGTVPASVTQNSGSSVTVASGSGLRRTGYTFSGWNTKADGRGTAYAAGSTISTGATLYAQWTANTYTVKFNANGGVGAMADQSLTYDAAAAALRTNSFTKDGYHFAGWATSASGSVVYSDQQSVKNLASSGSVTLYAVWTQNRYGISGTITSDSNADVTVKLMRGNTQIGASQTVSMSGSAPYTGTYGFSNIPAGTYNIVATQVVSGKSRTVTALVVVTNSDQTENITMPSGNTNSVLDVKEDTRPVVVGGLDAEAATKAEVSKSVTVTMTVEKQEEQQLPDTASQAEQQTQEAIAEIKAEAPGKTLEFMDIAVEKKIQESGQPDITEKLAVTNTVMEIVIPYDMAGKNNITVYRYHDGVTEAFAENTTKADGTFSLDRENNLIYVYAQKFSTYAIGYTVPSSGGSGSGGSSSGGGSSSSSGGSSSGNSSTISTPSAKNGTVSVSPKSASKGTTVTVTVTPDKGYVLETLTVTDASGKKLDLKNLGSGKYSFTMPASKVEVKATFMEDNTMLNYFVDVPASAYYYDAVLWAAERGITGGTDATRFSPDGVCTRAQAVTFLWRAAGSPAPSATAMPFTDVAADSYYYNAVLWAMENGITAGTSSTTFSPDLKCSRAHIMTFLWRSEKSPAAGSVNPFTDVSADAYYADAVLWAVKESVTNGTSSATFSPDADCTRAQIVTFIWRTLAR